MNKWVYYFAYWLYTWHLQSINTLNYKHYLSCFWCLLYINVLLSNSEFHFLLFIVGICSEFFCAGFFAILSAISCVIRDRRILFAIILYILLKFSFQPWYSFCRMRFTSYMSCIIMLILVDLRFSDNVNWLIYLSK